MVMKKKAVVVVFIAIFLSFLTFDLLGQKKFGKDNGWVDWLIIGDDKVSPKGGVEAFIIINADGRSDWLCLLDFEKQTISILDNSNHGSFDFINWSPDGKFIALEATPASGWRTITVINVNSKKLISMTRATGQ